MRYQAQKQEPGLRQELEDLVPIETAHPGFMTQELQDVRRKLESLEEDKYRGAIIRARAQEHLAGEVPTKRALSDEKAYARGI